MRARLAGRSVGYSGQIARITRPQDREGLPTLTGKVERPVASGKRLGSRDGAGETSLQAGEVTGLVGDEELKAMSVVVAEDQLRRVRAITPTINLVAAGTP